MTLLTRLVTIVFHLKIDLIVFTTIIIDIAATTIVDIIINKFNFVMTNIYFILIAIGTRCIILNSKKHLKERISVQLKV